ncbi:rhodanese-like domain-containing protein, partial [Nguyenibacter vanlangensis]
MTHSAASTLSPEEIRRRLREGEEIALLDLREEGPFATGHPLFAVNLPLGRIEERIAGLIPRRDAPIVLYDDGEGRVARALPVLATLGYSQVAVLEGGLAGWRQSGGEIFIDVNVPSKAFGELVEHIRHTPSIPARALHDRIARGDDLVILDARRFSEYNVMSIPGGRSVPGGELALRVRDIAPSADTTVVVNCAGRTRSIIGAQSLINAGIPNPVVALRNGTIGWTLEGLALDRG